MLGRHDSFEETRSRNGLEDSDREKMKLCQLRKLLNQELDIEIPRNSLHKVIRRAGLEPEKDPC